MVSQREVQALRCRLERARLLLLSGRLSEDKAWRLLRRTADLLDRAEDSDLQPTLHVIYTLIEAIWSNTRQQRRLAELHTRIRPA